MEKGDLGWWVTHVRYRVIHVSMTTIQPESLFSDQ